jgi:hypothetical protein
MAQPVGAVRGNLEFKDGICRIQFRKRPSHRGIRGQDKKPLRVIGQAQFLRAAKHSLALHPSQLADLDLQAAWQNSAREGQGHFVARYIILCPTHDSPVLARSVINATNAQAVSIGMWARFEDLCDDNVWEIRSFSRDAFHLYPSTGQQIV